MKFKIVSINRNNIEEISRKIKELSDIQSQETKYYLFDAKTIEFLELITDFPDRFPEQIFPIQIERYGDVYYVSSLEHLKPLPPNQFANLELLVKSLAPKSAKVIMTALK